eukprot:scpid23292/ scgid1421/ Tubulin polyglutamylase TTLL5; Tubulin--tyrosine ligase-like protein 5
MSSPISNRKKLGKLVTEHSTLARRPHAEQPSHGRQEPETVGATSLSVMPRMWTYPTHHAGQQHTTHTTSTSDSDPGDRDDRRVELPAIVDSTTFMWPGDGQVQRAVVMADQQPVLLFSTRLLLDKMQQDNGGSSDGDSALLPIAKVYSMKVVLDTDSALVSDIFRTHGFEEARNDDVKFNLIWTDRVLKPEILPDMRIYQKVNHFPRSTELCEDGNLFWNIQQMRSCKDKQLFDFMPDSYDLPSDRIELKTTPAKYS